MNIKNQNPSFRVSERLFQLYAKAVYIGFLLPWFMVRFSRPDTISYEVYHQHSSFSTGILAGLCFVLPGIFAAEYIVSLLFSRFKRRFFWETFVKISLIRPSFNFVLVMDVGLIASLWTPIFSGGSDLTIFFMSGVTWVMCEAFVRSGRLPSFITPRMVFLHPYKHLKILFLLLFAMILEPSLQLSISLIAWRSILLAGLISAGILYFLRPMPISRA